jgi:hypothetical protein
MSTRAKIGAYFKEHKNVEFIAASVFFLLIFAVSLFAVVIVAWLVTKVLLASLILLIPTALVAGYLAVFR